MKKLDLILGGLAASVSIGMIAFFGWERHLRNDDTLALWIGLFALFLVFITAGLIYFSRQQQQDSIVQGDRVTIKGEIDLPVRKNKEWYVEGEMDGMVTLIRTDGTRMIKKVVSIKQLQKI